MARKKAALPAAEHVRAVSLPRRFLDGRVTLYGGDSRHVLRLLPDNSIDSVVTDPPYALVSIQKRFGGANAKPTRDGDVYSRASAGFMGKNWDTGETAFAVEFWAEVYRVLKPGGHVVAFSGTRTYHRMACAIEDAGFEIRDQLAWAYGSGFPKSHDVSKAIDKAAGIWRGRAGTVKENTVGQAAKGTEYERTDKGDPATPQAAEWQGWGTALKPSWEPICMGRKPLIGTVAENVLEHGTGALNIDGCRVGDEVRHASFTSLAPCKGNRLGDADTSAARRGTQGEPKAYVGRWPANIVHDGSDDVLSCFPEIKTSKATVTSKPGAVYGAGKGLPSHTGTYGFDETGSAARFFYTAKADKLDRIGSKHPTVKPVDLMQWLVRMVTPPGGTTLDPFAGSGSTGEAAWREGMRCILIERETEYQADIAERLRLANAGPATRKARAVKQADNDNLPLFGGAEVAGGQSVTGSLETAQTGRRASCGDGGIMSGKGGFGFRIRERRGVSE